MSYDSAARIVQSLVVVVCVEVWRSCFLRLSFFLLSIELSVLLFTTSVYLFRIVKLFIHYMAFQSFGVL